MTIVLLSAPLLPTLTGKRSETKMFLTAPGRSATQKRSKSNILSPDRSHVFVLQFHNDLLPVAKRLISKHPLKAADAIHLSSALWLKHSIKTDVTSVASDPALLRVAQGQSLQATNPDYTVV